MEKDYEFALRRLREREVSLPKIAKDTGLTVPWLSSVARGLTNDPGVKKISKIAEYFRLLDRQAAERASHSARSA